LCRVSIKIRDDGDDKDRDDQDNDHVDDDETRNLEQHNAPSKHIRVKKTKTTYLCICI